MDTEPIAPPTFASPASDHEAEAPDAWSATEDPLAADAHQHEAAWREVEANAEAAVQAATQEFAHPVPGLAEGLGSEREQSTTADDGDTESIDVDTASFEEEADSAAPTRSEAPAPEAAEPHPPAAEATERFAAQPEPEQPRWSGPEAEPEAQGARWIGEALEGSTPLSPADLGTLASIGVTPGDGVGALRLLAALVRILNRSQLIEPDDLRAEIRESREAGAAAAAAEPSNGAESESSSAESSTAAET
jgi:hypothetical protein